MNQLKFFKVGFIVLMVLNLVLVAFLVMGKHVNHRPSHPGNNPKVFRQKIVEILELTEDQKTQFNDLANEHHQQMMDVENEQKELVQHYFAGLINSENNQDSEKILAELQHIERQKVELTYNHFEQVRAILSEEQTPQFAEFVKFALNRILLEGNKPPHPPKGMREHEGNKN